MAKDSKKMEPWERHVAARNMAEFYGVDLGATGANRRPGANYSGEDVKSDQDIYREINDKMANGAVADYLRYSGKDLPHASDFEGMHALHKDMKKEHKKSSGGSFNNASDIFGLSQRAFKADREAFTNSLDAKYAKTKDLNALKDDLMAQATDKVNNAPIEPSDRMAAVQERMESSSSNEPPSLYSKNNTDPATANDQKDAARNFLDDYKLDVQKGAGLKQNIAAGVSNAARHVTDTYGR